MGGRARRASWPGRLLLGALLLGAVLSAGRLLLPEAIRWAVVWRLGVLTGRPATVASVQLDLLGGRLVLRGLRLADLDGAPLLAVGLVDLRLDLRQLLRGHLVIATASLEAPELRIVRTGPRTLNISDLLTRPSRGPARLAVTLERALLTHGVVLIEDRVLAPPRTWRIDGITAEARSVSSWPGASPGTLTLQATTEGVHLAIWLARIRLDPLRFHATVVARDVDATLLGLYLPSESPVRPARGALHATMLVDRDPPRTTVHVDATVADLEVRRVGQDTVARAPALRLVAEGLRLNSDAVTLERMAVEGEILEVEDARLTPVRHWRIADARLEVRELSSLRSAPPGLGTAHAVVAGAPVSVWLSNLRLAPLELHATAVVRDVDLSLLDLYLPAHAPVRVEQGRLNATLRLDHEAIPGTRLAADAMVRDAVLRRPAHRALVPAVRLTAEDVRLSAGAVRVGRASVQSARMTLEEQGAGPARRWLVRDLALEATGLTSRTDEVQGVVTGRVSVAGATVALWVTHARLDPLTLKATAILRNLDLPLVQLYLPADAPGRLEAGVVNASLQVELDRGQEMRLTGDLTLSAVRARGALAAEPLLFTAPQLRLTLAGTRYHDGTLTLGSFEMSGAFELTGADRGARIELTDFQFGLEDLAWPITGPARVRARARFRDGGQIQAAGTAMLTAPWPTRAWTAALAVQADQVNLGALSAWVPEARGFRGRLGAAMEAAVAMGTSVAARATGTVRLSQLALVEEGRIVLGLQGLEATDLELLWPERIVLQRVHLDQPRIVLEREPHGLVLPAAPARRAHGAAAEAPRPRVRVGELVVDRGSLSFTDRRGPSTLHYELPRVDASVQDFEWPGPHRARLRLNAVLPGGGTALLDGLAALDPLWLDATVRVADADLRQLQPYLPFRAQLQGRADAALTAAGALEAGAPFEVRGDVTFRRLAFADGARPVITVDRLHVGGLEARWPDTVTVRRVEVERSWALIQRDPDGRFLLRELFQRLPRAPAALAAGAPAPSPTAPAVPHVPAIHLMEGRFEEGAATIVDATVTPTARLDITGARMTVQDLTWPARMPVRLRLSSSAPGGGQFDAEGTLRPDPFLLEARLRLDGVALGPAQPYLRLAGQVDGLVEGNLLVSVALEPLAIRVTGDARLRRFQLRDGDRPVLSAGRIELTGADVDWPQRVTVQRVLLRRPSVLIERGADGQLRLHRLVLPPGVGAPGAPTPSHQGGRATPEVRVSVGTLGIERALARFVDRTTTPPFSEEVSDVTLRIDGLSTTPGARTRLSGGGALRGGATVRFEGELLVGTPLTVNLRAELRDFPLVRMNPYLARFTAWTATRGTVSATAAYTLAGLRLDARHEIVVRHAEVTPVRATDEVEQRLGLPLSFLVALLKNARGEIRLSLPVAGDLGTREFDFREAMWGAVRAVAIRLLALPFARVGSLFFSEDSRVEAVAVAPVHFEAGTTRLAPDMAAHLDRVAAFLRDAPALRVRLVPILTQADLSALELGAPPMTPRILAAGRLEMVRRALTDRGIVPDRLEGTAPRVPLVEESGTGRVEFDLHP